MNLLRNALEQGHVVFDLEAANMASAIRDTVRHLVDAGKIAEEAADEIVAALLEREKISPTAIGHALAIPHAYAEGIGEPIVQFVRLEHPVNMGRLTESPPSFSSS